MKLSLKRLANRIAGRILSPETRFVGKHYYVLAEACLLGRSPSHGGIDVRARELLGGRTGGFYVEVGGADGVQWSNTLMLERSHGWRGLLVEPVGFQAALCRRARGRRNIVEQIALTAPGGPREIEIARVGLSSIVRDGNANVKDVDRHIGFHRANSFDPTASSERVPAMPFSELAKRHGITHVDFFSIDVEGFEIELLRGIDFSYTSVDLFVIETDRFDLVAALLEPTHEFVEQSGSVDYFFRARRP
jgi:FkbM family methyltransferase